MLLVRKRSGMSRLTAAEMGLWSKCEFSRLELMHVARRVFSLFFWSCVFVISAAAETTYHGSITISYHDPNYHGKRFDTIPMPVGGWKKLMSKLYFPSYLRVRPAIADSRTTVSVTINASGGVAAVSFSPPIHQGLEAVVLKAIYGTQWIPATKQNLPVRCDIPIPIRFSTVKDR